MDVIRHDDEGMQVIVSEDGGIVLDGFHDHVRDRRLTQVKRSTAGFVQESIHGSERLTGG